MARSSKPIFKKSNKNWRKKFDPVIEQTLSQEEKHNYFNTRKIKFTCVHKLKTFFGIWKKKNDVFRIFE
jgi:hypothetical protein